MQNTIQPSENQQQASTFTIGTAETAAVTTQASKAQQLEDKRKSEMFQIDSQGAKTKRGRQEYAEKLRKERRDDFMQKRRNMGGAKDQTASTSGAQGSMEDIDTADTKPKKQIISIEQAMATPIDQFVTMKDKIDFNVSINSTL